MELKENTQLSNGKYRISRFLSIFPNYLMYEAVDTHTGSPVFIMEFFMRKYCIREEGTQIVKVKKSDIQRFKDKQAQFLSESNSNKDLESTFKEKGTAYKVFKIRSERNRKEEYIQVDDNNYRPRHSAPQQKYNNQETYWKKTKADWKKRNILTNLFLYLLPLATFLISIFGIPLYCHEFKREPLASAYTHDGGIYIPLLIAILYFNHKILKWKLSGFFWSIPVVYLIVLPCAWCDCQRFLGYTLIAVAIYLLYFIVLKIPKGGISTWKRCEKVSAKTKRVVPVTLLLWISTCIIFSLTGGFYSANEKNIKPRNQEIATSSTYQDDTYTDDTYTDDSYSSDDEEEDNNGLIATGTYTIGDGQSFSVNEPIPYVGNTVVQVEFYEDYIMVDGDYYELVDGSGTRKEYSNGVGFRCYVSENYDMYLESTFNSPMGSMITTYPMTKGSWSHVQRTPHHTSTPSYDTDTDGRIHKPCRVCNMTGKCRPCKGTGRTKTRRVYTLDGYDLRYEDCHTCKGTGICIGCGGDGYIDNEDI